MLLGEYAHTVDDKGRFIMPTKLRDALHDGFIITKGLDGCLYMYDIEQWHILEEKLAALPMSNRSARDFVRFIVSGATDNNYDKQGRVLLPTTLREFAKLDKDIVIAGAGTHAEIWNADEWKKKQQQIMDNGIDALAEQMSDFGI
ncbi:MAG: division/cell wall cluster transcriptional repressor MraZ [Phascolarctobacterium sp.]|nr:division/cell wall cluster transcriptional repressor MraZ [Candidatus Phascolarctobacterium caballi]